MLSSVHCDRRSRIQGWQNLLKCDSEGSSTSPLTPAADLLLSFSPSPFHIPSYSPSTKIIKGRHSASSHYFSLPPLDESVCVYVCVCGYCTLTAVQACHTRIGFSTDLTGYQIVFLWISLPELNINSNGNTEVCMNYVVRWIARILIEFSLLLGIHAQCHSYILNTMVNNWNASKANRKNTFVLTEKVVNKTNNHPCLRCTTWSQCLCILYYM